jgi:hypothetical protein
MAAAAEAARPGDAPPNAFLERALTRLSKARRSADGLVRCESEGLVRIAVRPESIDRASIVLRELVAAAEQAGLTLAKGKSAATWLCDGETIAFELVEVADQVEHIATQKELDAVAKWKRDREERHRRYGYWQDWGEPKIPKWEQRYQGRLAIKLEEIRIQSEHSPWGESIMRTFADSRTRDVRKMVPRVLATIAAMAAAKKVNREVEARRRAEQEEARRRWEEAERRRREDERATHLLEQLLTEQSAAERLSNLLGELRGSDETCVRVARFINWAELRLERVRGKLAPETLEERLATAKLFEN